MIADLYPALVLAALGAFSAVLMGVSLQDALKRGR